ncbi:MAG: hypothetical protein ACRDM0_19740 [Thermoleophilaceae bacterium]
MREDPAVITAYLGQSHA